MNRHLVAALLVAPLLALVAYFTVDRLVTEQPAPARAGGAYPLLVKPNCRYASGRCDLQNGDLELSLHLKPEENTARVTLHSSLPLQGARISITGSGSSGAPASTDLHYEDSQNKRWQASLASRPEADSQLRLVVAAQDSVFFAETPTVFASYEAPWGEDLRREASQ